MKKKTENKEEKKKVLSDKSERKQVKLIKKEVTNEVKKLRKRTSIIHKQKNLHKHFIKAGYTTEDIIPVHKRIFFSAIGVVILSIIGLFITYLNVFGIRYLIGITLLILTFGLAIVFFIFEVMLYFYVDMKVYWRRREIEHAMPEYLLLASSNLRAGMLIDQALMYAIRPKFGALAKEMELVLKDVMAGKELVDSLKKFSRKYDSMLLDRSMDIIIEGIESGGSIAGILNKIAINLSELALQKKEMSASVTTYTIFISFATIIAAPILIALAGQLLKVIKGLMTTLAESNMTSSSNMMSFMEFSVPTLTQGDFMIFAFVMLSVSSFFSAIIISIIRKGDARQGIKTIPIFIMVSIVIFLIANAIMKGLFGSMFVF